MATPQADDPVNERHKARIVQFIKGAIPTGEERFFRRFPDEVQFHVAGEGYPWETQDRERDIAKAEAAYFPSNPAAVAGLFSPEGVMP